MDKILITSNKTDITLISPSYCATSVPPSITSETTTASSTTTIIEANCSDGKNINNSLPNNINISVDGNSSSPNNNKAQYKINNVICENKLLTEQNFQSNKNEIYNNEIEENNGEIDALFLMDLYGPSYNEPQKPRWLSSLYSVFFIITCALAVFIVFRNVLTWHLQSFWGASGDFWQSQWDKFIDITGDDSMMFWVFGTNIFTSLVYWSFGGIYTFMDITNRPAFLRKYKIQPGTNEPVDRTRLLKVISKVISNQVVVAIPISYLSYKFMVIRGLCPIRELPTFHWVCVELTVCILVEELAFYYSHRLLHHKYIYKFIHKQHHEWTAPISVTALYCHPIEHIFSNLLPPFLGVFIMGSHVATAWMWFALAILSTLNAHSGYHLPFFPSPEAHDFHHLKFNNCFGVLGVLDRLHGTDALFRATKSYARHIMMLSFVPPREAFPDSTMK